MACSVLEATLDYPFRYGPELGNLAKKWGAAWRERFIDKMARFFPTVSDPTHGAVPPLCYIFARTVPCPTTRHMTPLVSDWHLLKPKSGVAVVAAPVVNKTAGTWTTEIRPVGIGPGSIRTPPSRTYARGTGISLFSGEAIPGDWIKAQAQAGNMGSALYAVALKTPHGLTFRPPHQADLEALDAAERQLAQWRGDWEARNLIPTEDRLKGACDRSFVYGLTKWADMFSPRQLLGFGVLAGRGVRRALILPPANLLPQWQDELREKGGLRVPRLDGPKTLIWPDGRKQGISGVAEALQQDLLLMSRETARTEGNLPLLLDGTAPPSGGGSRPW